MQEGQRKRPHTTASALLSLRIILISPACHSSLALRMTGERKVRL